MKTLKRTLIRDALKTFFLMGSFSFAFCYIALCLNLELYSVVLPYLILVAFFRGEASFCLRDGGIEYTVTRGITRGTIFAFKVLPPFVIWPFSILWSILLLQHRPDNLAAGFICSWGSILHAGLVLVIFQAVTFDLHKKMVAVFGLCFTGLVALSILSKTMPQKPSFLAFVTTSLILMVIGSFILILAYRRFLKMEVV